MKSVFITGASGAIGTACANLFYEKNYNIIYHYNTNAEKATEFLKDKDTNRVLTVKADLTNFSDAENAVKCAIAKFKKIDVLVNNAGISQIKPFADITEYDWDNMYLTNVKSVYNTTKAVIHNMLEYKSGSIINISSIWGEAGASCEVHYSASKAAIIGFTKALAKEMGLSNIRVNCVAPGVIKSPMNSHLTKEETDELIIDTPLSKLGTPYDVASAVYYLSSDDACFITGQTLGVNGGFVI